MILIKCSIQEKNNVEEEHQTIISDEYNTKIKTNIYNCFTKNLFTDFAILVGAQVAVHSVVLSAMSDVLNASMCQDFKEKSVKEIEIKGFEDETVNDAIEFIYSGSINDTKCV